MRRFVYAIRIYENDICDVQAELAFGNGGIPTGETETIKWTDIEERERIFKDYAITGYTYIWDERCPVKDMSFDEYIMR